MGISNTTNRAILWIRVAGSGDSQVEERGQGVQVYFLTPESESQGSLFPLCVCVCVCVCVFNSFSFSIIFGFPAEFLQKIDAFYFEEHPWKFYNLFSLKFHWQFLQYL